ncbi:MAG TPA: hypothetical protein VJ824_17405, partial [Bacillota bacterium]|nr:hypothetical protein [Bacillota bacterium]
VIFESSSSQQYRAQLANWSESHIQHPSYLSRITSTNNGQINYCLCFILLRIFSPEYMKHFLESVKEEYTPNLDFFDPQIRISLLYILSDIYFQLKEYKNSEITSLEALQDPSPDSTYLIGLIYNQLGISQLFIGKTGSGIVNMTKGLDLLRKARKEDLIRLVIWEWIELGLEELVYN